MVCKMEMSNQYHTTVLLEEAVDGLAIKPDGVYVDATFGGGGHSRAILEKLGKEGRLVAFDQDVDAWQNIPDDERLIKVPENFKYMRRFLRLHGYTQVDGILADLGVSSFQFDTAERGFSIRYDGPLDMRMDKRSELTAAEVVQKYSEADLHQLFEKYGEVRNAKELARHLVAERKGQRIETIATLKALLGPVIRGNPMRYLAQVFQALRIEVNSELDVLKELLEQSVACLGPGGRLSVISFHSLEDRIVKQFIKKGRWSEVGMFETPEPSQLKPINAKPIEPTAVEMKRNPRSRSARLRVAEKI